MFRWCFKNILVISFTPIISTFTAPIFTKFAGLLELWQKMNDLKLFSPSLKGCCYGNQFFVTLYLRNR